MKEYNITDFGAVGNGNSDCTAAIQKALDTAGERTEGGAVLVPPGIYQTGPLRIPSHVALRGIPSWGYKTVGGSILRWRGKETANDKALLDITGSVGCRISGLCLEGSGSQGEIHGISFARQDFLTTRKRTHLLWKIVRSMVFPDAVYFFNTLVAFQYVTVTFLKMPAMVYISTHGMDFF